MAQLCLWGNNVCSSNHQFERVPAIVRRKAICTMSKHFRDFQEK